jgi:hypothetical protein
MTFELFAPGVHRNPRETSWFATIASPRIVFSLPCAQWFTSQAVNRVQFLWDRETRRMAFRPTETGGYKLAIKRSQACVSAKAFLKHIGNPPRGRYTAKVSDDGSQLEVKLGAAQKELRGKE